MRHLNSDSLVSSTVVALPAVLPSKKDFVAPKIARLAGLDTLRACAILMVIPYHAKLIWGASFIGPWVDSIAQHGWAGVELFFVLSGFLIGSQLIRTVTREGKVSFGRFYFKRSLRILPSYVAVILVYLSWPAFREKHGFDPVWRFLLFFMNYIHESATFSHAWSLCVEEHFYWLFPVLVAAWKLHPKIFRPKFVIVAVLLAEPIVRLCLWAHGAHFFNSVYRPTHTRLDGLTVGVALAALRETHPNSWAKLVAKPRVRAAIGLVAVATGAVMFQHLDVAACYALCFSAVALGFGALTAAAMAPNFWLAKTQVPGASMIATLAYTLYLTHKQMIHFATVTIGNYEAHPTLTLAFSAALVALAALILHYFVERPFLRLRDSILH